MYKYNPNPAHLFDLCTDYIDKTAEINLNENIYTCCIAYLSGNFTARQKEVLNRFFKISE